MYIIGTHTKKGGAIGTRKKNQSELNSWGFVIKEGN